MGNFEKVVVLLILLVCAIVLGISLRAPEPLPIEEGGDRFELASRHDGPGQLDRSGTPATRTDDVAAVTEAPVAETKPLSLPGETEKEVTPIPAPTLEAEPPTLTSLASLVDPGETRKLALVSADGLRTTSSPDYMLYTCRVGDTWQSLAESFYGKAGHAELLQIANEDARVAPGKQLLVPKFDFALEAAHRDPAEPREEPVVVHVVESGDTLSEISSKFYGTSGRWMAIYDANRDVLASPDALRVGLELRIP